MAIINRMFTYRGRIKVSSRDLALARSGRKTCTVRLGKLGVAQDVIYLSDGRNNLKVKILEVDNRRVYRDLTDRDAIMDGLESKQQLDEDLRKFYGQIDPNQPMTIVRFRVLET